MHQAGPAMYSCSGPSGLPLFDFGSPGMSDDLQTPPVSSRYVAHIWGVRACVRAFLRVCADVDASSVQLGEPVSAEEQAESW